VSKLKGVVRNAVRILEDRLKETLFPHEEISVADLAESFRDHLLLKKDEGNRFWLKYLAIKLAKYLIDSPNIVKFTSRVLETTKTSILEFKIRKFGGKYEKILEKNIELILFDFKHHKEPSAQQELIEDLTQLSKQDYITTTDITDIVVQLGFKFDIRVLWTLLLRHSNSVHHINRESLRGYLIPLLESKINMPKKKIITQFKQMKFKDLHQVIAKINSDDEEEVERIKKEILFKIADNLFSKNQTLMDIFHKNVFDKVIDGKEYQLIRRASLINTFKNLGIPFSIDEQMYFKDLVRPIIQDFVDVKILKEIMEDLGISEDIPPSTRHMDYNKLEGPSIRIFNRIIKYMKRHKISDVVDFLCKENWDLIEVVGKEKRDNIQVIEATKMRDILRNKDIIGYGEDLNDNFAEFLEVSPEYSNIIMVRKLKKALKDIENCRYFQRFGVDRRVKREDLEERRLFNMNKLSYKKTLSHSSIIQKENNASRMQNLFNLKFSDDLQNKIQNALKSSKYIKLGKDKVWKTVEVKNSSSFIV
jgi:hypothetical protein